MEFTTFFILAAFLVAFLVAFFFAALVRWPGPTITVFLLFVMLTHHVSQERLDEAVQNHPPTCTTSETATIIQHLNGDVAVRVNEQQAATIQLGQPLPDKPQPGNTYYTIDAADPLGLKTSYVTEETCLWESGWFPLKQASYTINRVHQASH